MLEDGLRPDRLTYSRLISVAAYWPPCHGQAYALYARMLAERVDVRTGCCLLPPACRVAGWVAAGAAGGAPHGPRGSKGGAVAPTA